MCPPMCLHWPTSTYVHSTEAGAIEAWAGSPRTTSPDPPRPEILEDAWEVGGGSQCPQPHSRAGSGALPARLNATTVLPGPRRGSRCWWHGDGLNGWLALCACVRSGVTQ